MHIALNLPHSLQDTQHQSLFSLHSSLSDRSPIFFICWRVRSAFGMMNGFVIGLLSDIPGMRGFPQVGQQIMEFQWNVMEVV